MLCILSCTVLYFHPFILFGNNHNNLWRFNANQIEYVVIQTVGGKILDLLRAGVVAQSLQYPVVEEPGPRGQSDVHSYSNFK